MPKVGKARIEFRSPEREAFFDNIRALLQDIAGKMNRFIGDKEHLTHAIENSIKMLS